MKITTRLSIAVLALLLTLCIGIFIVSVNNGRHFFSKQLDSNAQDTATALGLSVSQALTKNDKPIMQLMVQAVFDRGYFKSVEILDVNGNTIISRSTPNNTSLMPPQWFRNALPIASRDNQAKVMDGGKQVGSVYVASDPSGAYLALWNNAVALLFWYIIIAIIALIITVLFVKWLLFPLERISAQAKSIAEGTFLVEPSKSKIPEFRQVLTAMNQMVMFVQGAFKQQGEQIRRLSYEAYTDLLTGLGNIKAFTHYLQSHLMEEDAFIPGYFILVNLEGLEDINKHCGHDIGDTLIKRISSGLFDRSKPFDAIKIMRLNGSEFGIIAHAMSQESFKRYLEQVNDLVQSSVESQTLCKAYVSAVELKQFEPINKLLSRADHNLGNARLKPAHLSYLEAQDTAGIPLSRRMIDDAFKNKSFVIFSQEVHYKGRVDHKEMFVRLRHQEDYLPAGYFMPLIESEKYATAVDLYVLDYTVHKIEHSGMTKFSINISGQSILDASNRTLFLKKIKQLPDTTKKQLTIEINELYLINYYTETKGFVEELNQLSISIAVDHVGEHFSVLAYMKDLPIQYLKVDGFLLQDLINNDFKQFYIQYFTELAETMNVSVIATQVETKSQYTSLQKLNIHCFQGNYIAKCTLD